MPRTLDEEFRNFLSKLTPTSIESEDAKKHRVSIENCLKNNFDITRFFRIGSFGNGTSISSYSDVDYFASIPRKHLTDNSYSSLRKVKNVLISRFPNTGIYISTPAVVAPFGNKLSEWTEIVPADFIKKNEHKRLIYEIPNTSSGWTQSSPDAHNAYVTRHNKKFGGKLKSLIRFLKAWKYYRKVPISSFYLELRTTKYMTDEKSIVYSIDLRNILKRLLDCDLASIQDPLGISGYILPCSSDTQKDDALSKLETALTRADKAREAEKDENIKDAFYWWNLVFANKFPSYYY